MKKNLQKLGAILALNFLLAGFLSGQETPVKDQQTSVDDQESTVEDQTNAPLTKKTPTAAQEAPLDDELVVLDPFVLTEATSVGYGTSITSVGSRFNADLLDISHSITPVNHELMDDIGAIDGEDALRYIAGIGPASTVTTGTYVIRGFEVRSDAGSAKYLDGLPGPEGEHETEFVERFEVIKGAAGTLYGEHSLGGLINRVYKNPTKERQTTLKVMYSSLGNTMQGSFDTSGSIDRERQLSYRIIGVYRDGETNGGAADDKEALYGTIVFEPEGSSSRIWGRASYQHITLGHETATVFFDGAGRPSTDLTGSETRIIPHPNNEEHRLHYYELGYSNRLSGLMSDWNLRVVGRYDMFINDNRIPNMIPLSYQFLREDGSVYGTSGTSVRPGQPLFADFGTEYTDIKLYSHVSRVSGPTYKKNWGVFADLTGAFDTGPVTHNLLIYSQLTNTRQRGQTTNYVFKEEYGGTVVHGNYNVDNAYSIINPVYLPESMDYYEQPGSLAWATSGSGSTRFNFGFQDNIYMLNDNLLFTLGARYDFLDAAGGTRVDRDPPTTSNPKTDNNWVYKAGAVYKIVPNKVALFANYSETFQPKFGLLNEGTPAETEYKNLIGESKEVGVKLQLYENALLLTGSYFVSDLTNQPIRIFDEGLAQDIFVQDGVTTSEGWELELAWMVSPNFTFQVALTDQETNGYDSATGAKTRKQRNGQNGFRYSGVAKYTFTDDLFRGLSLGVAVVNLTDRNGDSGGSFVTEGYTKADLFATYLTKDGRWRFQVNVNNVFDVEGTISSIIASLAFAEDPRHIKISTSYRF